MFRNSKSNPAKNKDRLRYSIKRSFDIPARQKKVRPCLLYFFKCVAELKESSFRGFGLQKGMLAGAQYVVRGPEMFDLVDKEVYPEFARGLNKGDRPEICKGAIVGFLGDGNKPPPFPKRG
jgi:hypothetical protein